MRTRYQITEPEFPYFITSTIIEWLPIFTRKPYFDIVIDSLHYARQRKGLKLFAYVTMDNHIHLIAAGGNLAKIIGEFKSYAATQIVRLLQEENRQWLLNQLKFYKQGYKKESHFQVWQEGFHPKQISSDEMLRQKIEYIHSNPVRAGFVERAEDWLYSSARNYLCGTGVSEIDVLDL